MDLIWDGDGEVGVGVEVGPLMRKGRVWARQFMCKTKRQRGSARDMSIAGWFVFVEG